MIAVAFDLNFRHAAEIFGGVSDYVSSKSLGWRLVPLNFGFEARMIELAKSGQLDGAIGTFVSDRWVDGLTELGVSAVNLFNFSKIETVPSVGIDDCDLGQQAAQHFIEQGAERLAFFGADSVYYTRLRRKGYSQVGDKRIIDISPASDLLEQLAQLKLDDSLIGIFCSSDALARELIVQASKLGYRAGKDFLIAGVDNDPSESIFAGIELTCFKIPAREVGFRAAEIMQHTALSDLSAKKKYSPITCSGIELLPRESSLASPRARATQVTINRMRERFTDPDLDIESLAREAGLSRRGLEVAFQEQLSQSPYRYLSELRADEAKRLLQQTVFSINDVGRRVGYPEPHHFSAWFKKLHGMSPKNFRRTKAEYVSQA